MLEQKILDRIQRDLVGSYHEVVHPDSQDGVSSATVAGVMIEGHDLTLVALSDPTRKQLIFFGFDPWFILSQNLADLDTNDGSRYDIIAIKDEIYFPGYGMRDSRIKLERLESDPQVVSPFSEEAVSSMYRFLLQKLYAVGVKLQDDVFRLHTGNFQNRYRSRQINL